ncbi:agamous-like MADS-box protein AGL80 [Mangifera indica]|uniref:agamous-like MADS-box protein AGL80 n=1 Tax=Mangifera indica TaxID=29780 RepID=UPI001CF94CC1|nr:agamous-like MADS-box protein AGL80 [Mangifera indica]XP_044470390.1 agamous-like MADS-box protein AGL80 [Mangifera indica]XP_044470398.1 agamous-like MADS-box protein AGL80 [Mangifera indica]XP_044470404.1 agamous-like MADS-box protein AGL80 [Mangifera indica]XP_044477963.1 agamous-like MADS-box protein AGL80 [Mangifera indica]
MTRKKVKLAFISNDSARKATFKKRKKGLMKKVSELSTLCGIDACAIIYSPYESHAEIWPSPMGVQRVLSQFKKMPEMEQSKKMVNQDSFLRQRIGKGNEQLKKQRKDNREREMTEIMFQSLTGRSLHGLNILDLNDIGYLIDQHLKDIHTRVDTLNRMAVQPQPVAPKPLTVGESSQQAVRADFEMNGDAIQRQQWFIDLMNPPEQMGFGGEDIILPFGDANHNSLWSNAYFP